MRRSPFQFRNPFLVDLNYSINQDFESKDDEPIDIKIAFNVQVDRHQEKDEAIVELTLVIGTEDSSNPFCIKATEGAIFKWDGFEIPEPDKLLKENAPALLLGYLRPIVSVLTAASPFNAYNIPFIDFTNQ